MVKGEHKIHLLLEMKQLHILANMMSRAMDIKLNIQNIHSLLKGEYVKKQFNDIVKGVALEVGGKIDRQNSSKLLLESKRLLQKRKT